MAQFLRTKDLKSNLDYWLNLRAKYERIITALDAIPSVSDPTPAQFVKSRTLDNGLTELNTLKAKYERRLAELGG